MVDRSLRVDAEAFRESFTKFLASRPTTAAGEVRKKQRSIAFGYPGGNHGAIECWEYRRNDAAPRMYLAFHRNYTPNDLIVKVADEGQELPPGCGASVQFNANYCVHRESPRVLALVHRGVVTVGSAISRARLIGAMQAAAPGALATLGGLIPDRDWPHRLGDLRSPGALLDQIFLYGYCVEQGKRHLQALDPLAPL